MKKYWIYVYTIVVFIMIFSMVSTVGKLAKEYLLPSLENMMIVSINVGDYFYWALASSFLLFSIVVTLSIIFYKLKNSILLNSFLTILLVIILWFFVNSIIYSYLPHEKEYAIAFYPLYTKVAIIIALVVPFSAYLLAYFFTRKTYE